MCAWAVQCDDLWVGTRIKHEVIFQLSWSPVVDHADAGVHVLVANPGIGGNVGSPLFRIATDKIVHFAGKLLGARNTRRTVGADETHPHHTEGLRIRVRSRGLSRPASGVERRRPSCKSRVSFGGALTTLDWRLTQNRNAFIRCEEQCVTNNP